MPAIETNSYQVVWKYRYRAKSETTARKDFLQGTDGGLNIPHGPRHRGAGVCVVHHSQRTEMENENRGADDHRRNDKGKKTPHADQSDKERQL
jgi:hypothetical protein